MARNGKKINMKNMNCVVFFIQFARVWVDSYKTVHANKLANFTVILTPIKNQSTSELCEMTNNYPITTTMRLMLLSSFFP